MLKQLALISALCVAGHAMAQNEIEADPVVERPKAIKATQPEYPPMARRFGHQGRVIVSIHVSKEGQPQSAEVLESSDWQELDDAALRTVMEWQFNPAKTRSGALVASATPMAVVFKLTPTTIDISESPKTYLHLAVESYYLYSQSSRNQLQACGQRGFDITHAKLRLDGELVKLETMIAPFIEYMRKNEPESLAIRSAPKQVMDYERYIRVDELYSDSTAAKTRCTHIISAFEQGRMNFQHFDSLAYRSLGEIKLKELDSATAAAVDFTPQERKKIAELSKQLVSTCDTDLQRMINSLPPESGKNVISWLSEGFSKNYCACVGQKLSISLTPELFHGTEQDAAILVKRLGSECAVEQLNTGFPNFCKAIAADIDDDLPGSDYVKRMQDVCGCAQKGIEGITVDTYEAFFSNIQADYEVYKETGEIPSGRQSLLSVMKECGLDKIGSKDD